MIVSKLTVSVPVSLKLKARARMLVWQVCALFGWQPTDADYDTLARWALERMRITVG